MVLETISTVILRRAMNVFARQRRTYGHINVSPLLQVGKLVYKSIYVLIIIIKLNVLPIKVIS